MSHLAHFTYDSRGFETQRHLSDGVITSRTYDAAGQVTDIVHLRPVGCSYFLYYTYDADGRRTEYLRDDGAPYHIYYDYDAASRLTAERWLDGTGVGVQAWEYQYDPAGNRTRMIADDVATYYGYDTLNQLTATAATDGGATGYTYTPDGALAWRQGPVGALGMTDQYFTWDVDEALHCIDLQYAQGAARVRTYFTHDADMHSVRRDDVFSNSVHKYVTHALDGDRWAYIRSDYTDPTWLQSTGPGVYDSFLSFCLIADPDWTVAPNQCHTYDALGSEFAPEERSDAFGTGGGLGLEFGYRDYLSTTALYQLWHRWYDPTAGRFVSRDPIARQGVGAYPYVSSNPTRWVDPTGLTTCAALIEVANRIGNDVVREALASPLTFPGHCQALNNVLYRALHDCYGFSCEQTGTGRAAWPDAPSRRWAFMRLFAYGVWWEVCHRHPPRGHPEDPSSFVSRFVVHFDWFQTQPGANPIVQTPPGGIEGFNNPLDPGSLTTPLDSGGPGPGQWPGLP